MKTKCAITGGNVLGEKEGQKSSDNVIELGWERMQAGQAEGTTRALVFARMRWKITRGF